MSTVRPGFAIAQSSNRPRIWPRNVIGNRDVGLHDPVPEMGDGDAVDLHVGNEARIKHRLDQETLGAA